MKLIVANWKCNPPKEKEAIRIFNSLERGLKSAKKVEVVICPPFVYLLGCKAQGTRRKVQGARFKLGAQNCFWEEAGAFTGEISPLMLKDMGVKYVILGHSERRGILKETNEMVAKKLKKVLESGILPIFCIGENKDEKGKGKTFEVLEEELKQGLKLVPKNQIPKITIAYEPIWAIGTKNPCSVDDTLTVILFIRKIISRILTKKAAKKIRILYGGSVDSNNAKDYLKEEEMNGLLVGGASLNSKEFLNILKIAGNH